MVLTKASHILAALLVACLSACNVRTTVSCPPEPQFLSDGDCFVSLLSSSNNQTLRTVFDLTSETMLRIVYQGEGANSDMAPTLVDTYHNDCVEFYIDTNGTDRQFRFVWGSRLLTGKSVITDGIRFAQEDPSDKEYCFEIEFPWKSLGIDCPGEEGSLIVDCSVIDNDAESRKTQIAWYCKDSEIYQGSHKHGRFSLSDLRCATPPVIDGIKEEIWDDVPEYKIENQILGKVHDPEDLSAVFRVMWDKDALYVYIGVWDDKKKMAEVLFDRAELLDESGMLVWRPYLGNTCHAGGALKNRRQEDTITLSAGRYVLRYTTDESHSAGHWDDTPPTEEFTGIKIFELN